MSTNVVVFGFGAILILVAIIGGGFELKEFKVPKVGWAPRLLAGVAGLVFVVWGAGMSSSSAEIPQVKASSTQEQITPAEKPVEFTIYDQLGQDRLSEQVTVLIDGKIMGQLTADNDNPRSMLTVTVPHHGGYSYMIDATKVVNVGGTLYRYAGTGQGTIQVEDHKKFELVESSTSYPWMISIMEQSELQKSQ